MGSLRRGEEREGGRSPAVIVRGEKEVPPAYTEEGGAEKGVTMAVRL